MLCCLWGIFFKINNNFTKNNTKFTKHVTTIKTNPNSTLVGFYLLVVGVNLLYIYTTRGRGATLIYNHISVNNYTLSMLYAFSYICLLCFFLLKNTTKKTNLICGSDYLFSIINLVLILPYLFFVNTIFTFLFLLELISTIIFYKLVSSKIWFKNQKVSTNTSTPQTYINMVFFQYWVTFLATIFIVYFYINMFCIYGTSD